MVCISCIVLPAFLILLQFIYNQFPCVKTFVHRFFPSLRSAEEDTKAVTEEESRKAQEAFWGKKTQGETNEKQEQEQESSKGEETDQLSGSGKKKSN